MKQQQERAISNVRCLLTDLKSCSVRRDIEWGRRIHAKVVETRHEWNIHVVTALMKMYAKCGKMADARCVFDSLPKPDAVSWTALLLGYADNREGQVALDLFSRMKAQGCAPDSVTYVAVVKACASLAVSGDAGRKGQCLERGRQIHSEIGRHMDQFVQNTLVDMYAKCGSMAEARRVFDSIQKPTAVSWSCLLLGYVDNGEGQVALGLFSRMKARGCAPDSVTFIAALKACTCLAGGAAGAAKAECLERGREIHMEVAACHLNLYLQNTLVDMYAKCGSMAQAQRVFADIQRPDVVSWNNLLMGYAENGEGNVALHVLCAMKVRGCAPDSITYVAALKACTALALQGDATGREECLERGRAIHSDCVGCSSLNHYVESSLIDMYAKSGVMDHARRVFDGIHKPVVVSWNALLQGYAETGEGLAALDLFSTMKARGCQPNSVTYVAALKACASLAANGDKRRVLQRGREIHSEAAGCHVDAYVQSALIDMYARCGSTAEARQVFDSIDRPDVVAWNALLMGLAENGEGRTALDLFSEMKGRGYGPTPVTYVAALKACTSLAVNGDKREGLERGREIHSASGPCRLNCYVQNTLIDMYAKCGSMPEARRVFESIAEVPEVVSWNALIMGYAENGEGHTALDLIEGMKARGCEPDSVTYMGGLKACGAIGALASGRKLHTEIREFSANVVTCLVDFYAKCGSMVEAREVFNLHARARSVSTWNALLAGYGSFGDSSSAFNLFEAMQDKGFQPDAVTFVCMLLCCSHAGVVEKAREYFEAMPVQYGVTPTVVHYTCMVDVLGRANQLNEAVALLRKMPCNPDAVTWRVLLDACRKWKNVEIGSMAFQALVDMDKKDASAYVLMAQIYDSRGMREEQERVLETWRKFGACELPGFRFQPNPKPYALNSHKTLSIPKQP